MDIQDEEITSIINNFKEGIFIEAINGDILRCNQVGAAMFGYTPNEITTCNIRDLVPSTESYYLKEQYTQNDLFPDNYVYRLNVKRDKTLIHTEINSKIVEINGRERLLAFVREAGQMTLADPAGYKFNIPSAFLQKSLMAEKRFILNIYDSTGREKIAIPLIKVEYVES